MIGSTLTRRKQRTTNDVLGRTIKAETFNWDGATVYSTVTNTYNALDQVTLTKQYAGSTSSSTVQETTAEYDGYGRLYRQHVPEQFSPGLMVISLRPWPSPMMAQIVCDLRELSKLQLHRATIKLWT